MDQEELQYEEVVEAGDGGDENFVGAPEDEHHLNDTDQSIETELEAIKGEIQFHWFCYCHDALWYINRNT